MNRRIVQAAVFSFLAVTAYVAWLSLEGDRKVSQPWIEVPDPQD